MCACVCASHLCVISSWLNCPPLHRPSSPWGALVHAAPACSVLITSASCACSCTCCAAALQCGNGGESGWWSMQATGRLPAAVTHVHAGVPPGDFAKYVALATAMPGGWDWDLAGKVGPTGGGAWRQHPLPPA